MQDVNQQPDQLLNREYIERRKALDGRLKAVDIMLQIEQEMRDSISLKMILAAAAEDAEKAMEELAEVDPTDTKKIIACQARVYRAKFISQTLGGYIQTGQLAENSLRQDDLDGRMPEPDGNA